MITITPHKSVLHARSRLQVPAAASRFSQQSGFQSTFPEPGLCDRAQGCLQKFERNGQKSDCIQLFVHCGFVFFFLLLWASEQVHSFRLCRRSFGLVCWSMPSTVWSLRIVRASMFTCFKQDCLDFVKCQCHAECTSSSNCPWPCYRKLWQCSQIGERLSRGHTHWMLCHSPRILCTWPPASMCKKI